MKTILLIENKLEVLENLTEAFEMEGYKVLAANNGTNGVELAREFIPDLIISAILIGKMGGYQVLQALSDRHRTFGIPFIFSTTQSEMGDRVLAFELGASDYIVKPYGLEEMFTMARKWINSGSQRVVKRKVSPHVVNVHALSQNLAGIAAYN